MPCEALLYDSYGDSCYCMLDYIGTTYDLDANGDIIEDPPSSLWVCSQKMYCPYGYDQVGKLGRTNDKSPNLTPNDVKTSEECAYKCQLDA